MTATTVEPRPNRPPAAPPRSEGPAHLGAAEGFLALVTLAVIIGFSRIFTGATYSVPLILMAGAVHVWLLAARRRGLPLGLAAIGTLLGFVVLSTWFFFHETAWLGVIPTGSTAHGAQSALSSSWHAFQQVVAPTAPRAGFMVVAAGALCVAVFLADWAAFRLWAPIEALVPTLTLAGFTMFVGSSRGQILTTMIYAAAAMGFVLEHRVAQRERSTTWLANQVERGSSWLVHVGAAAVVASVVVGSLLAPHLPGAGQPGALHWHGNQGGSGDRVTISPLVDIGSKLNDQADTRLFTVTSSRPAYWRLTSLDTFTGQIWESSGKYDSASGHLSGTLPDGIANPGKSAGLTQTFTISQLAELWLPAAYVPVSLQTEAFRARYQASTSTLIVDTNLTNSDSQSYTVRSIEPNFTAAQLRSADRSIPSALRAHDLAVPGLSASAAALARQITAGAATPYDKALALQDYFRSTGGFVYDDKVSYQNDDHAMDVFLRQKRGYCQQFAGTFAALARSIGLPTRVAVGFTPGVQDTGVADQYDVRGAQAHAWPEVYLGQYGWVPFEPTPGRGAPNEAGYLGVAAQQDTGHGTGPASSTPATVTPSTVTPATAGPASSTPHHEAPTTSSTGSGSSVDLSTWVGLLALLALGLAVTYLVVVPLALWLRHRRRRLHARAPGERVRLAWVESEEALALLGQARRRDETAREFAGRVGQRLPTRSNDLMSLATTSDAALFGVDTIDEDTAVAAEQTTATVATIVAEQLPWRRRVRAQLDIRRLRAPSGGATTPRA
jgi:transglutaminase-like putative cysteine protease